MRSEKKSNRQRIKKREVTKSSALPLQTNRWKAIFKSGGSVRQDNRSSIATRPNVLRAIRTISGTTVMTEAHPTTEITAEEISKNTPNKIETATIVGQETNKGKTVKTLAITTERRILRTI
jgi:hypothetical protein